MSSPKSLLALGMALIASALVMGQHFDFNLDQGITIEESYLQESVELMIIREQSRAESREMKLSALSNIAAAIERGIKGGEVLAALEYLAFEGIVNKTVNKRAAHYPDIKVKTATCLGELGSPEAAAILIKMVQLESEPMVLTEAVRSLAKIGINENEKTVQTITKMFNRFNMFYPDNLLALSCLEAYERFAAQNSGKLDAAAVQLIFHISEGTYHGAIRQRAKQLLTKLRTYSRNYAKD